MTVTLLTNEKGQCISISKLEKISDKLAEGNIGKNVSLGPTIYGIPEPINNKKATLCVSVPVVMKQNLDNHARDLNCTSSELFRALISRELMNA